MKILSVFIFIISMSTMANSDFEKAEQLFRQNKLVEAKALFEKHLKANPNHTKSLEYLGDIAGKNKNWDEAIGYYKKIKIQY
jgi:TolA-binding protein